MRGCAAIGVRDRRSPRPRSSAISRASMRRGVVVALVVVALQVQHAVDHQVRVVRGKRLALRARLLRDDRRAQHDVAGKRHAVIVHECQHVGRVVAAAVAPVERAAFAAVDEAQRDRRVALERAAPSGAASARAASRPRATVALHAERQRRAGPAVVTRARATRSGRRATRYLSVASRS